MFLNPASTTDYDPPGTPVEQGIILPVTNAKASWFYYDIVLECVLDSGIVVHRRLPQFDPEADSLSSFAIDDGNTDAITGSGANTVSNDYYKDIVQRMAHSQYWFHLHGQAIRIGEQVPIPGLKTVGGVIAYPHDSNPQRAWNKIVGNYSGLPLWHAYWSLWYTVIEPPTEQQVPPANLAAHIAGDVDLPTGMQSPFSQPDDSATAIPELRNPISSR